MVKNVFLVLFKHIMTYLVQLNVSHVKKDIFNLILVKISADNVNLDNTSSKILVNYVLQDMSQKQE